MASKGGFLDVVNVILEKQSNINLVDQVTVTYLSTELREFHVKDPCGHIGYHFPVKSLKIGFSNLKMACMASMKFFNGSMILIHNITALV